MKKLISLFLVCMILLSVTVIPTFAITTDIKDFFRQYNLYSDEFIDRYNMGGDISYKELYYHRIDSAAPDSDIEWVFISGYAALEGFSGYKTNYAVVGDKVIFAQGGKMPFSLGYLIYDVAKDEFIHITDVDVADYEGLNECLDELRIGRPIGDADCDAELTIMDATEIQRALAGLCEFGERDLLMQRTHYVCVGKDLKYVSDMDRDGDRTIMDATAIQLKLAKLDYPVATPDEAFPIAPTECDHY